VISKLIFVYNANSGAINALLDSAHKIISPQTYDCKLCELTYGVFKEDEEWLRFLEGFRFRESEIQKKPVPHSMRYESVINTNFNPASSDSRDTSDSAALSKSQRRDASDSKIVMEFLHKDEFNKKYWSKWLPKYEFPIILSANEQDMYNDGFGSNGGLDIFMSAADFKELKTTSDLIDAIKKRLQ